MIKIEYRHIIVNSDQRGMFYDESFLIAIYYYYYFYF